MCHATESDQGATDLTLELRNPAGSAIQVDLRETGPEIAFASEGNVQVTVRLGGKPVIRDIRIRLLPGPPEADRLLKAQAAATAGKQLLARGAFAEAKEKLRSAEEDFRIAGRAGLRTAVSVLLGQAEFALGDYLAARNRFATR